MSILDTFVAHAPALIVAIPLLGAFLVQLVGRLHEKAKVVFALLTILLTNCFLYLLTYDVFTNGIRTYIFGNADLTLPVVRILFEVDAMSIYMALISTTLILVAFIFSWVYMKDNTGLDKFYTLMLLLTAGMLGMVFTGDIFNFFVFLEITGISSAALVAFWVHKAEAVEAGFKYILISAIGALFVLFAIALLYGQYDALNIAVLAQSIQFTFLDKIALVILLVSLAMKAGLFPMHMWLPDSYSRAPAPVTIGLVAATLASFYGVLRVIFSLYGGIYSGTDLALLSTLTSTKFMGSLLIGLALLAILVGVIMALRQTDLKRLIAFAAVAEIGYMFLGIGTWMAAKTVHVDPDGIATAISILPYGNLALQGGIFHLFNDAFDIGLLFLVAGVIFFVTKERSLDNLSGLARHMKATTIFFIIGLCAVAGLPPLNGFASKLLLYESTFQLNPILGIVAIVGSILLLAVFVKVFYAAFMGPDLIKTNVHKEPRSMIIAMGILAAVIIIIGLFPDLFLTHFVEPATDALLNFSSYTNAVLIGGV